MTANHQSQYATARYIEDLPRYLQDACRKGATSAVVALNAAGAPTEILYSDGWEREDATFLRDLRFVADLAHKVRWQAAEIEHLRAQLAEASHKDELAHASLGRLELSVLSLKDLLRARGVIP